MIGFHLTLAWRNLRRTPWFSAVMLASLVLAIAGWYVPHQIFAFLDHVPLENRPGLRSVAIYAPSADFLSPERESPFGTHLPGILLSGSHVTVLMDSGLTRRESATFAMATMARADGQRPIPIRLRFANRSFFEMFDVPFSHGGPWSVARDEGGFAGSTGQNEIVIGAHLAEAVFGDEPALGRKLEVAGIEAVVVGVIAPSYRYSIQVYDPGSFDIGMADVHISLSAAARLEAQPEFLLANGRHGEGFAALFGSQDRWLYHWAEFDDASKERAYVERASALLAHGGAAGHRVVLRSVPAFRAEIMHADGSVRTWPILANLTLLVCLLNLMRLLMAKFNGRGLELGVLRAFGARRRSLIVQLLLQATLIGLAAGILGTAVGAALVPIARASVDSPGSIAAFSALDALLTIGVSTATAVLAAVYPAWRLSRVSPASHLGRV